MLPFYQVDHVRALLADGTLSHRRIARLLEVSRGAVEKIAAKYRLDLLALLASEQNPDGNANGEPNGEPNGDPLIVPPERCPTCGGMVDPPCRLCLARKFQQKYSIDDSDWRPPVRRFIRIRSADGKVTWRSINQSSNQNRTANDDAQWRSTDQPIIVGLDLRSYCRQRYQKVRRDRQKVEAALKDAWLDKMLLEQNGFQFNSARNEVKKELVFPQVEQAAKYSFEFESV
jgi:hypothetical protein